MDVNQARDDQLTEVANAIRDTSDVEHRLTTVFRETFDQLYDGQRTGRYSVSQLYKTEKTHFGTLVEINLRREFADLIFDGDHLDFKIRGHEIDCKFSFKVGGWMLPPECINALLLVCTADDQNSEWSIGVVRARPELLRGGVNRDAKSGLNADGRAAIDWIFWAAPMLPNVLLQLDAESLARMTDPRASGQKRVNALFRLVTHRRIGRNTVATVAQQDDFMKRVRANGGARSALAAEGFLIMGGDYESHRQVAEQLHLVKPEPGEFVSARVVVGSSDDPFTAFLDGELWRVADESDPVVRAPALPTTKARVPLAQRLLSAPPPTLER